MAKSSLKSTLAVSLNNYLDAGAIVAGGSGISLWQSYLGLSEMHLGWLNAISANALGAAIGAIIAIRVCSCLSLYMPMIKINRLPG